MPLLVNLRHLEAHNIELKGELPAVDLDLDVGDEMVHAEKPLRYELDVQPVEHALLLHGRLHLVLQCHCVRCLKPFEYEIKLDNWTRHLPLQGEEKAVVTNDCVDLTPFVREDILLEFPQHPLCEPNCRGLPSPQSGQGKRTNGNGPTKQSSSAWAALDRLKL